MHLKQFLRKIWFELMDSKDYIKYLRRRGVKVGDNVVFRYPSHTTIDLTRPCLIEFGSNLDINDHFTVLTHDFGSFVLRNLYGTFINSSGKVIIGNNIVFGRDVTVLKGVTIGDNCIIGLGSIITKSIPANSLVAGRPAKVLCSLEDYYAKRKAASVQEALEYARELIKSGHEPSIEDFTEEWVLFLTKDEYSSNSVVRSNVIKRLRTTDNVNSFFQSETKFSGFDSFIQEAMKVHK